MMDNLHHYLMQKKGAEETYPFGDDVRVYKVMGKMFALMSMTQPHLSLKCDPTLAQVLRQNYEGVQPGYHLNKQHWNTVTCDGSIPEDEILEWIDMSYDLIVQSLTKKLREELNAL
jgi:predicted DNA-binding protein (MmcQ/YjbR family)